MAQRIPPPLSQIRSATSGGLRLRLTSLPLGRGLLPPLHRRRDPLQRGVHPPRLLDLLLVQLDHGDAGTAARPHADAARESDPHGDQEQKRQPGQQQRRPLIHQQSLRWRRLGLHGADHRPPRLATSGRIGSAQPPNRFSGGAINAKASQVRTALLRQPLIDGGSCASTRKSKATSPG
jgi:hypothetical protein